MKNKGEKSILPKWTTHRDLVKVQTWTACSAIQYISTLERLWRREGGGMGTGVMARVMDKSIPSMLSLLLFPATTELPVLLPCDMWEASAEGRVPAHNQWCHNVMCCSRKRIQQKVLWFEASPWKFPTGFWKYPPPQNFQWPYLVEYGYFLEFPSCEYRYSLLTVLHPSMWLTFGSTPVGLCAQACNMMTEFSGIFCQNRVTEFNNKHYIPGKNNK